MNEPGDPGNPLEGLLGDLLKMIGGAPGGASAWFEAARSLAQGLATDGAPEGNVDPLLRIRLEELARVAELHVADATGLALRADAASLGFNPVGRGAYSQLVLESWRPWVERMVRAQEGGSSALDQLGSDNSVQVTSASATTSPGCGAPGSLGPLRRDDGARPPRSPVRLGGRAPGTASARPVRPAIRGPRPTACSSCLRT